MQGKHARLAVAAGFVAVLSTGCVDPFQGSKIEILFQSGTPVAGSTARGAPPTDTHLEMYVFRDSVPFHLLNFELVPLVDPDHPCFIELDINFPLTSVSAAGLHSTQWYTRLLELYEADGEVTTDEAGALADALARERDIVDIHEEVKAVVSTTYGPPYDDDVPAADLQDLFDQLPPITAIDDESNRTRLELCQAFFADHPDYYVGSDRLITRPINGVHYGVADGEDPRSGGFIGGASLDVDANLPAFDAMRINWQFNDPDDPRAAPLGNSEVGYHFMAGAPEQRTRGVVNVRLENDSFSTIAAEAAIFADLDRDDVHF